MVRREDKGSTVMHLEGQREARARVCEMRLNLLWILSSTHFELKLDPSSSFKPEECGHAARGGMKSSSLLCCRVDGNQHK